MDKEVLLSDLEKSTQSLLEQLSRFNTENFNYKPSDTEWSAAQVAEHLLILETLANKIMRGESIATNRPADSKTIMIKLAMEDINTKRPAPEMVQPSHNFKDAEQIKNQFIKQRELLKQVIDTTDITEACINGKHPALGTLTKLEWIYFIVHHTQRHLHQMMRLEEKFLKQSLN